MQEKYLDDLLTKYVSSDELRPKLTAPTLDDGFVFASDAYQMIRIPQSMLSGDYREHIGPDFKRVMPSLERIRTLAIEIDVDFMVKALSCRTKYPVYKKIKCDTCDGDGVVVCKHCNMESECKTCDGDGELKGEQIGETYRNVHLSIGSIYLNADLFENAITVAQAIGKPLLWLTKDDGYNSILFGCGDIQILIMPFVIENIRHDANAIIEKIKIK